MNAVGIFLPNSVLAGKTTPASLEIQIIQMYEFGFRSLCGRSLQGMLQQNGRVPFLSRTTVDSVYFFHLSIQLFDISYTTAAREFIL